MPIATPSILKEYSYLIRFFLWLPENDVSQKKRK